MGLGSNYIALAIFNKLKLISYNFSYISII